MRKLRREMEKVQDSRRFEHTLGVEFTAASLAMRYGASIKSARTAGLLHDCAKCLTDEERISICRKNGIPISEMEWKNPFLLHAKAGAFLAKKQYGIEDEDILNAICSHTTGRPGMSLLEMIVFVADYIEPGRNKASNLEEIRRLAFTELDQALLKILGDTLEYLESGSGDVDPMTRKTWEYYMEVGSLRHSPDARASAAPGSLPAGIKCRRCGGMRGNMEQNSMEMAKLAVKALEDKKAEDIRIIDISQVTVIADYFLIAGGNNRNQIQALCDNVEETLGRAGFFCRQKEGYDTANWILMDFGDVIVHIFDKENRLLYDLERIWRDGRQMNMEEFRREQA